MSLLLDPSWDEFEMERKLTDGKSVVIELTLEGISFVSRQALWSGISDSDDDALLLESPDL